jgi:hypothetical protein
VKVRSPLLEGGVARVVPDRMPVRVSVVGPADGTAYEIFTVESLDLAGARLTGPLSLELGEEITLRLSRGDAQAEVTARVSGLERGEHEATAVVTFTDADAADRVRPVVG